MERQSISFRAFLVVTILFSSVKLFSESFYQKADGVQFTSVFELEYEDVTHQVKLGTAQGRPVCYKARLISPVCEDSICELLYLDVYWDLLGTYLGFDTVSNYALTKYNHEPFTASDYQQLDDLLQNTSSALATVRLDDIVLDEESELDGRSGATNTRVKEELVQGAAYTCHFLWYFVNKKAKVEILRITTSEKSEHWIRSMLNAENENYASYLFSTFGEDELNKFESEILNIFKLQEWGVTCFVTQCSDDCNLPIIIQEELLSYFEKQDAMTRLKLMRLLNHQAALSQASLEILSDYLYQMSYMQIQELVDIYSQNRRQLSENVITTVKLYCKDPNAKYAFMFDEVFLF